MASPQDQFLFSSYFVALLSLEDFFHPCDPGWLTSVSTFQSLGEKKREIREHDSEVTHSSSSTSDAIPGFKGDWEIRSLL